MSEVIDKLIEKYPVYKDVNREALIDAVGKKYPVYLEHADFKDEFDQLQALNKSVQEGSSETLAPAVVQEPTAPLAGAFDQLFNKAAPAQPGTIPDTTTSPLTQGAAERADAVRTGVSHSTAVLADASKTPLISFPKPVINENDPPLQQAAKGIAEAINSGLESMLTESTLNDVATAGPLSALVFGTLGAIGTVKSGVDLIKAGTAADRGRAIGSAILNAGMTALAYKGRSVTPEALAPRTVEAAKSVIGETAAPKVEAVEVELPSTPPADTAEARTTVIPAQDTNIGKNVAGEPLYQQADGQVYQMRGDRKDKPTGYPDFGGDLAASESGPGIEGMGAATPSEFPTAPSPVKEALDAAVTPIQKVRRTIAKLWNSGEARDAMAYSRDAGDNAASLFARQAINDVRQPLKRAFEKESPLAEDALTFAREAGMNEDALRADRAKVAASKEASSKWGRKAIDAMDYALYHLDELKAANERYGEIADAQQGAEEASGIPTLRRENYVPHVQDVEAPETFLSSGVGAGSAKPFTKVRTFDKLADSIAAGIDPKTVNSVDLLEHRLRQGQQLINNRAWVENLKSISDPTSKGPIGRDPVSVKRTDGTTYLQAPSGYELEYLGNQPIAIHKGYEGIFSALTDPSFFRKSMAGRAFLQGTGAGKSLSLMLDTFHLGRVAYWESLIKSLGIETFKAPFPSYKKGLTLLDYSETQIREMGAKGEIPADWAKTLTEDKHNLDGLVKHGYNLGRIQDALYQDLIHKIPGLGKFNRWLFEQFQRGAMNEIGLLETQRLRNARPEMPEQQVWRQVAKDLNTRFGNLGRQGVFKSRSGQDLARLLVMAPQWNEGLIRSEIGAVTQTVKAVSDIARGEKVYGGVLMRSVGAMALMQFAANQLLNLYTRGKPTWENPEEGFGAKVSAWIPDKIGKGSGFFLHPLGLAAETTHLITSKLEKTGDLAKTLNQYLRSRSSTSMRPVLTFITQQDFLGRNIKPGSVWSEMAKSALPAPIGGSAVVAASKQVATGQPSEVFPGQFQKQVMASVGIKTDQAPSPEQRIAGLAKEFNTKHGIDPSPEFYVGDFQALTQALRIGNENDAKAAMEELIKKKTTAQIVKHFSMWANHPFTRQRARENQFKQTLTPEQKTQYETAVAERRRIGLAARALARQFTKP